VSPGARLSPSPRPSPLRARPLVLLATLAVALEATAALCVVFLNDLVWLGAGTGLHVAAALIAWWAAGFRRDDLCPAERDLVLYTGLLVPLFGPPLAWALPRPKDAQAAKNAHRVFEEYSEHVKPPRPDYERTLFTGDYAADLARELDAESYHEVLRHGSTDQKRNALRRLAELGEPHHFDLIRKCLVDPEHEVRLYAYSELERSSRPFEEAIAASAKTLKVDPDDREATEEMARTYLNYAGTGIHDASMAAFYFRAAQRYAGTARALGAEGPEMAWIEACALGRVGEFAAAETALAALPFSEQEQSRTCLIRAELAFLRRDYAMARVQAEQLKATGTALPGWLAALEGKR